MMPGRPQQRPDTGVGGHTPEIDESEDDADILPGQTPPEVDVPSKPDIGEKPLKDIIEDVIRERKHPDDGSQAPIHTPNDSVH